MHIGSVVEAGIAALTAALACYVLWKNPRRSTNRSFFILCVGIIFWTVGILFVMLTERFVWITVALWGGELIVLGLVFVAQVFPEGAAMPIDRRFILFLTPFAALFALTPSRLVIRSARFNAAGYLEPKNGILFPLFALVLGAYLLWSFSKFFSHYRALRGIHRVQMRYLIVGAGSFVFFGFLFDILLPAFNIFELNLFGPLFSLIFISLIAYAIVRHEFMDIRVAIKRGISYICVVIAIAIIFFCVEFVIEKFLYTNDEVVDIIAAAVGALLFARFRSYFEKVTDNIFFRGEYRYADAVSDLGEITNSTIDLPLLLGRLADFLAGTVKPAGVAFFLKDVDSPSCFGTLVRQELVVAMRKHIFADPSVPFFPREAPFGIVAMVPLVSNGAVVGTMFLAEKLSDDILRQKDKELLSVFSHQAGMAIENARLYLEAKEHAETLEKKVVERTSRITEMQGSQSKFLADISHELQTPVTILRGNLEIIVRGKSGERKQALQSMETTLDRMSRLIENLLSVARLNFSKDKLHKQEIKVQNLLEDIYGDCFMLAENAGVLLSFASDPVSIGGDRDKLKEVILNLVSNALKHTPRGGAIGIFCTERQKDLEIVVQDSGKGIASENIPHLFERFYRISDGSGNVRGNGLGLNICRQIIETHGGTINVESELGKGSRFIILLPLFIGT